jgi:hypothetical protein
MRPRAAFALAVLLLVVAPAAAQASTTQVGEWKLPDARMAQLQQRWADRLLAQYPQGTWAPMRFELNDEDLALMGLPPKRVLLAQRYSKPTVVEPSGKLTALEPGLVSFAGAGFFGIRPGAFVLLMNGGSIGWCSLAHVYGSSISTAGHCGNPGDTATVIGAVGNKTVNGLPVPVLIDFGRFSSSTGDGGIGNDWALISVDAQWRSLLTPTMAFWGGPIGTYTSTGEVVAADTTSGEVSVTPNPTLVQQVVHYGHGAGLGAGGTPRSGSAINWRSNYFTAFGAISPGDSGSGSNTLTGDAVGDNREAAGINTHIYVDGSLRTGLGTFAGTRATRVGSVTNGQILPYPAPLPVPLP